MTLPTEILEIIATESIEAWRGLLWYYPYFARATIGTHGEWLQTRLKEQAGRAFCLTRIYMWQSQKIIVRTLAGQLHSFGEYPALVTSWLTAHARNGYLTDTLVRGKIVCAVETFDARIFVPDKQTIICRCKLVDNLFLEHPVGWSTFPRRDVSAYLTLRQGLTSATDLIQGLLQPLTEGTTGPYIWNEPRPSDTYQKIEAAGNPMWEKITLPDWVQTNYDQLLASRACDDAFTEACTEVLAIARPNDVGVYSSKKFLTRGRAMHILMFALWPLQCPTKSEVTAAIKKMYHRAEGNSEHFIARDWDAILSEFILLPCNRARGFVIHPRGKNKK